MKKHHAGQWKEHAMVGAGVGVAGAANTVGLIGVSLGTLAALPIAIFFGIVGALLWWLLKTITKES